MAVVKPELAAKPRGGVVKPAGVAQAGHEPRRGRAHVEAAARGLRPRETGVKTEITTRIKT